MPPPSDPPVLAVEGLKRSFGALEAVRHLDLSIEGGETVALWGPNGSGKSTVLRCIAGVQEPTAGSIRLAGHTAGSIAAKRLLGTSLSQERSFYLRMSGHRNLLFFARLRYPWREAEKRVAKIEEELEIGAIAEQRAETCSTGMLQQLGLGRALLGDPAIVALDEPTRSLDAAARARLWAALERREDLATVIATHREDDLQHCGRQIDLPR